MLTAANPEDERKEFPAHRKVCLTRRESADLSTIGVRALSYGGDGTPRHRDPGTRGSGRGRGLITHHRKRLIRPGMLARPDQPSYQSIYEWTD
ncbi:MAG TPA: hypothetical protein VGL80_30150 [Pseudonocardiaceae bacterium]